MKIYFFWPFKDKIPNSGSTESYEFYNTLLAMDEITLVNSFEEADYIFFMMDLCNCYNMPHYKSLDINDVNNLKNYKEFEKYIIIDYNDWTDTRNVPENILKLVKYYFKRSIIKKENSISKEFVEYSREIITISYGIRSDFIEYDKIYQFKNFNYDICCMFNGGSGIRSIIPSIVNKYNGPKFVGKVYCSNRYGRVNTKYFEILKTSKIIVTANPPNWEGDYRLWEALLMGNLVLCDKMLVPSLITHPLINKKHLVYYNSMKELELLINYYINNETERDKIGKEGRKYSLKYHKFTDRVTEVINTLHH